MKRELCFVTREPKTASAVLPSDAGGGADCDDVKDGVDIGSLLLLLLVLTLLLLTLLLLLPGPPPLGGAGLLPKLNLLETEGVPLSFSVFIGHFSSRLRLSASFWRSNIFII